MSHEPWGSVAGALLILGFGVVVGTSWDDAGSAEPRSCPAVPVTVAPETTTTGTLPPEVRPDA